MSVTHLLLLLRIPCALCTRVSCCLCDRVTNSLLMSSKLLEAVQMQRD